MKKNYLNFWIISAVFLVLFTPLISNQVVNAATVQSISLVQSGLLASDPLNNETKTQQQLQQNPGYWYYNGDAPLLNANYSFFKDTQGLHVGTQAPANGTYAGFYAETPNTNAVLYHAIITSPVRTIPSNNNFFFNGIYIQTQQPFINYVSCVSNTGKSGTVWQVGHTYGSPGQALVFDTLWTDPSPNQPLTRDCTIITNGQNYLKVYLDGVMVYSSNLLALAMPAPFNLYLEPQNSYADQLLYGTYMDYYITSNETIQIIKNPVNATKVTITDASGNVLASASVSSGTAFVDVGKYHFPLTANINVYDSGNTLLASTSSPASIFGGDVYSISTGSSVTVPSTPTGLNATAVSSSQINLSWTAPSNNGGSAITGYKIERSINNGTMWSTSVSNTGSTATTYSDAGLSPNTTYSYRVSAINSVGTSAPSNTASATTMSITNITSKLTVTTQNLSGKAISGLDIELYKNGIMINSGYSPVTFTLNSNQLYTVVADDYLTYMFNHWFDTGSTNSSRDISISSDTSITAVYKTLP